MSLFKRHVRKRIKTTDCLFGGCGGNFALRKINKVNPETCPDHSIVVMNTDADHLESLFGDESNEQLVKWGKSRQFYAGLIGEEITQGDGAGADFDLGLRAARAESTVSFLRPRLQESNVITLVAGAGKGTGGTAMQVAAEICCDLDKGLPPEQHRIVLGILIMARGDEGFSVNAAKSHQAITALIPTITIYNSKVSDYIAKMPEKRGEDIGNDEANKLVDELAIVPVLEAVEEVTQRTGEVHLDRADIRTFFRKGKLIYAAGVKFRPEQAKTITAQEIFDELVAEHHFQETQIVRNAEALGFWFIGWDPLVKKDELFSIATKYATEKNPNRKQPIDIFPSIRKRGVPDDEDRRVIMFAVAREIPEKASITGVVTKGPIAVVKKSVTNEFKLELDNLPAPIVEEPRTTINGNTDQKSAWSLPKLLRPSFKKKRKAITFTCDGAEVTTAVLEDLADRFNAMMEHPERFTEQDRKAILKEVGESTTKMPDEPVIVRQAVVGAAQ
jgi:cell division GTPase FtsZ